MPVKIRLRRGTAAEWTAANPVLAEAEVGLEKDTRRLKFGDNTTPWNSLPYGHDNVSDIADSDAAIAAETAARIAADTQEETDRIAGDSTEASARIAADAALQAELDALPAVSVPTSNQYTFTNATPLRTIDVSTATPTDALNCLAAIVADLKAAGILPP